RRPMRRLRRGSRRPWCRGRPDPGSDRRPRPPPASPSTRDRSWPCLRCPSTVVATAHAIARYPPREHRVTGVTPRRAPRLEVRVIIAVVFDLDGVLIESEDLGYA